jgi:hypothetical protein
MRKFLYLALVLVVLHGASGANPAHSSPIKSGIALTYANDKLMDGAGAQLQRIYGIYALSRYLHVPYIHTPLKKIGYQGLAQLEKNRIVPNAQDRWNRVFKIRSDIKLPPNTIIRYIDTPKEADIERYKNEAEKANQFYLLQILLPYEITDRNPEIYRYLRDVSPFHSARSEVFRIAIHVRRGDEFAVDSQRMLPNSYYVSATMKIVAALRQLDIPFVCELYTEVASRPFVVTSQTHGIAAPIKKPVTIDPKMNRLEDFDVLPHLHKYINTDPIDTLRGMATADVLIISRSSFSYLAALFNKGTVIYFPFWHKPLNDWLTSDINGNVSSEDLVRRLQAWKDTQRARHH